MEELLAKKRKFESDSGEILIHPQHRPLEDLVNDLDVDSSTLIERMKEDNKRELEILDLELASKRVVKEKLDFDDDIIIEFLKSNLDHFKNAIDINNKKLKLTDSCQ
jgi:hypothetical protein